MPRLAWSATRVGQPAVVPQQRLDLGRDQLEPAAAADVVPGPAVRGGDRGQAAPQLVAGRVQRGVRRHVVGQAQFVDAEALGRLGYLGRGAGVRREVGVALVVDPDALRVAAGPHRVGEVHDLPGVGRVRRRGPTPGSGAGRRAPSPCRPVVMAVAPCCV